MSEKEEPPETPGLESLPREELVKGIQEMAYTRVLRERLIREELKKQDWNQLVIDKTHIGSIKLISSNLNMAELIDSAKKVSAEFFDSDEPTKHPPGVH